MPRWEVPHASVRQTLATRLYRVPPTPLTFRVHGSVDVVGDPCTIVQGDGISFNITTLPRDEGSPMERIEFPGLEYRDK